MKKSPAASTVSPAPANAALYPRNRTVRLDEKLFLAPSSEYRGTPFWSWNTRLVLPQLERQMEVLQRMGFGGVHMHSRTGLDTEYLGDEFLAMIRACTQHAAKNGLLAWLYDEDRWPSGFAGGLVTSDERHRMKYLLFTPVPYGKGKIVRHNVSCGRGGREETGRLLARYAVTLNADGTLASYTRLDDKKRSATALPRGAQEWFAYLETAGGVPWFNHQTYADTLSPAATERFIEVTHERFKKTVGEYFGGVIPAIFTDEPQHVFKEYLAHATQLADVTLPATDDFFATYQAAYRADLLDRLPELFWDLPNGQPSDARYHYHDHATERFANAYSRTLGQWCEKNNILLTGHMMDEPTLSSQTRSIGEAMRSLAHFQLPGIDMLADRHEYTTAKQAQSVAHQYARPGVLSELYGVTGWHYDFVGHKGQGDWQAALGVTVRVPHLAWLSMAGEAKRDYPASINYQSPWCEEYTLIENHFARVNTAMTRGRPLVRVGIVHPIESYWLCHGPLAETKSERDQRDRQFLELPQWLLGGLIDFDYICEALLPAQTPQTPVKKTRSFAVGEMAYDVVIVPAMRAIRTTTLARLEAFAKAGGAVIFAGEIPTLVDARPSTRAKRLAASVACCEWNRDALLALLEPVRELDCKTSSGVRPESLLHQIRDDGEEKHIFICNTNREQPLPDMRLTLRGSWRAFFRETLTGGISELFTEQTTANKHREARSVFPIDFAAHGHALITLRPGKSAIKTPPRPIVWRDVGELVDPVPVTLSEPNVLLLDQAEWRWNDGPWESREELLRINNTVRARCKLPLHEGNVPQPWTDTAPIATLGRVTLRFKINSEIAVAAPELALENAAASTLHWDGKSVASHVCGWWVDEAIRRIALPAITPGEHELTIACDFTRKTEIEWCYLLGDFGVQVSGRHARLTTPVRSLAFGDWTRQGLPFYAGNVTYDTRLPACKNSNVHAVQFPRFVAPLLRVTLRGRTPAKDQTAPIAFAPHRFEFGSHATASDEGLALEITAYGNRHNSFGPLHNIDPAHKWTRPHMYRSTGDNWAYEYQLKPMGLLVAPRLQTH